jgi:hypothetical protein
MKTLICIAACFFSVTCFGQTKLISFRSHSGSNANFHNAVELSLFDIGNSNFGIVVRTVDKIDSVILITDNKIVVQRKIYTMVQYRVQKIVTLRDTIKKANAANFFKANNTDSLRSEIHKTYKAYILDSIRFVGFDKKFKQKTRFQKK